MPDEQEKTILTQKIRHPDPNKSNPWIDILEIKEKKDNSNNTETIIYTNSIITNKNMYQGSENENKPVSTETIQSGAIKNIVMYQPTDEDIKNPDNNIKETDRPISTNTIQNEAITTSKIKKGAITVEQISSEYIKTARLGSSNSTNYILQIGYEETENDNNNSN